jgi:hypothetical protein
MRGGRWKFLAELVLVVALAGLAAWVFGRAPARQAGDEANWLGTARFFQVAFVHRDVSAEAWPDSYWTRTQPMVPRYIMGGWLTARGVPFEHLDPNFDHRRKWFSNVEAGKAPDQATLTEARLPMRGLAVLSAVLLYGVVRVLAEPLGGTVAALLFIGSPYLKLHLVRVMGEPPFMAFLLATLLVLVAVLARRDARPGWRSMLLAGALFGLAFGSKLTAIIAIVGVAAWGVWAALGPAVRSRLAATARAPLHLRPLAWAVGVVGVALAIFVLTNPFLYRDPVGRSLLLFQNRQYEMAFQAEVDPERAVPDLRQRVRLVLRNSLWEDTWSDSVGRWPLEAPLAAVGFGWLLWRGLRWQPGPESLLLLWVTGFYLGVSLGLGYLLDHYFVPTATLGVVLAGVGAGVTVRGLWQLAARLVTSSHQLSSLPSPLIHERRPLLSATIGGVTGRAGPRGLAAGTADTPSAARDPRVEAETGEHAGHSPPLRVGEGIGG